MIETNRVYLKELNSFERVSVSEPTRRLLQDFAAADVNRPLHRVEADWENVFQAVGRNGLLGVAYQYLSHHPNSNYPPPAFRKWVKEAYRGAAIRMALMYRRIGKMLRTLIDTELDFMVIKGPALAHSVYPNPDIRAFNDLDLLIRERDWTTMHQQLLAMGFKSKENLPEPPPKLTSLAVLYEQTYWHPQTNLVVEVHYDDLLNAGLASRNFEGFWQRSITVEFEGVTVKTLSLEDQLLHLCMHAHYHGYTRLNWLTDIAILVREHGQTLDWDKFIAVVRSEEAEVGVYYTLHFMAELLDVAAPPGVISTLKPDSFRRWWHEFYMPNQEILSLEPMWRADFSFYIVPLFKRLIPDLLVMGRRRDKFKYLGRLLLPPRRWLKNYYQLDDSPLLPLHYLLHPLKLATHYLIETFMIFVLRQEPKY